MSFDPQAATAAYIDSLGADALAKAAAYTTGGHWLLLWNLLVSALIAWLIVRSGILDRISAKLGTRGSNIKAFVIAAAYFLVANLISLPWTLYQEWWRELGYGRTSQPIGDFLGQSALSVAIFAVLVGLFFVGVYALMRRAGRFWWVWSGGLTAVALSILLLAGPVFIEPLFNDYQPVPAGEVRDALVVMAKQASVPEDRLFVYDGSRQSNNFTANVSGLAGSVRIAISDIAFKGATLDEVKAVTGHEIGHYVLGHVWRTVILLSVLAVLFFFVADRTFPWFARAFGSDASIGDPTGLPVLVFMVSLFLLFAQPLLNDTIRTGENRADQYSLETVNLPDALATALVKTAEYRNPRPEKLEEVLFYTHPSVERRVRRAMEWKASHPQ
ncbi:MAG: M48 family metalloprotease [Steroidobacteraceae bacterium]|jgi:STE24 endopeptidase|nr:M48 family metalloprotease [Steroidobacteraceae bacterium]MBP9129874.1 M48 family metalloprotease [Steroidobacteraceae bacterium]